MKGGPAMVTFQPNTVLPDQLPTALESARYWQGEKRLMAAVLGDAVHCFQSYIVAKGHKEKRIFDEAEAWILSNDSWFFGFNNVCAILNIDADYLRAGLIKWKEQHRKPAKQAGKA